MTTQELTERQEELKEMADALAETEAESLYDSALKFNTMNSIITELLKLGYEKHKITTEAQSKLKAQFANFLQAKYALLSV